MTLGEMLNSGIQLMGPYVIQRYNYDKDKTTVLMEGEEISSGLYVSENTEKILETEVKYIYVQDEHLYIELEDEE